MDSIFPFGRRISFFGRWREINPPRFQGKKFLIWKYKKSPEYFLFRKVSQEYFLFWKVPKIFFFPLFPFLEIFLFRKLHPSDAWTTSDLHLIPFSSLHSAPAHPETSHVARKHLHVGTFQEIQWRHMNPDDVFFRGGKNPLRFIISSAGEDNQMAAEQWREMGLRCVLFFLLGIFPFREILLL